MKRTIIKESVSLNHSIILQKNEEILIYSPNEYKLMLKEHKIKEADKEDEKDKEDDKKKDDDKKDDKEDKK
jgi:hypothetical protein